MPIYQTLSKWDFIDAFTRMGRGDQFSSEALEVLYDYFDEFDEPQELDVVAVCCEFTEYSTPVEYVGDHPDEEDSLRALLEDKVGDFDELADAWEELSDREEAHVAAQFWEVVSESTLVLRLKGSGAVVEDV